MSDGPRRTLSLPPRKERLLPPAFGKPRGIRRRGLGDAHFCFFQDILNDFLGKFVNQRKKLDSLSVGVLYYILSKYLCRYA
jgi:hypothetical protein